jgi:hypothetical protein
MPGERLSMRKIRELLRLRWEQQLPQRVIANSLRLSQASVSDYLSRARRAGLTWPLPDGLDDAQLEALLFPPLPDVPSDQRPVPDWSAVHRDLRRPNVTLALLWEEYRAATIDGFGYSWFCDLYREWAGRLKPTLRQVHIAGERLFVDFAGHTMEVIDAATGEIHRAEIFVAVLGASSFIYAEATASQALADWIGAHVNALTALGGVPRQIVSDYVPGHVIVVMCRPPLCAGPPANPGTARRSGSVRPHINQSAASHSRSFGSLCHIGFRGGPTDVLEGGRHASRASCFILIFISA